MARQLKIPPEIAKREDLSIYAKACYGSIVYHLGRNEACWPSRPTIARQWAISVASVKRGMVELQGVGLIDKEQRLSGDGEWHSNKYELRGAELFKRQKVCPIG